MTPSNIVTYMNGVKNLGALTLLSGRLIFSSFLAIIDRDHSFPVERHVELVAEGDNDTTLVTRKADYEKTKAQWKLSDRVTLVIMDHTIDHAIRALPKTPSNVMEFITKIEEHFQGSSKASVSMLITKMLNAKYTSQGSVRKHIMKFIDMSNKLKDLEMPLPEPYLIHYIMLSLTTIFDNFKINYNGSDNKWNLVELIAKSSK
jgi:hypothetical protein